MTTSLLLLAYGASAIRRHPGVDEKVELFSDAVRRVRKSKGSMPVSSRFEKLLEEWEGSSWSTDANFTSVVVQIENDLMETIRNQHDAEQSLATNSMNELVCKDILVKNAVLAAKGADERANSAVIAEKAGAEKLRKSLTKLKNMDLIKQRSLNIQSQKSYDYPEDDFDASLGSFSCEFDCDGIACATCDDKFETYRTASTAQVEKVKDHMELEQTTWVGFDNEAKALIGEQLLALGHAQTSYSEWVDLNFDTKEAWALRESHMCKNEALAGVGYYGLLEYTDGLQIGQVCVEDEQKLISFQAQHTDFCILENAMTNRKTRLTTANQSGSQDDQQYEEQVLETILCILRKLNEAETISTDTTGVASLVQDCQTYARDHKANILPYTFASTASLDCKKLVGDITPPDGTPPDWCFSGFSTESIVASTDFTDLTPGSETNPGCVTAGDQRVILSGKMSFRWRSSIYTNDASEGHPLTSVAAWDVKDSQTVYLGLHSAQSSFGGAGFLTEETQGYFYVWARTAKEEKCSWSEATFSSSTGFESKFSSDDDKLCAIPVVDEYITVTKGTSTWGNEDVGYAVAGVDNGVHKNQEILSQCFVNQPPGQRHHW